MPTCVVFACTSSSKYKHRRESKVYFHKFPNREKSPERFAQWVSFCRRKNFTPSKSSTICSVHFMESDHDPSHWMKQRLMPDDMRFSGPRLKPGAVPSIPPKSKKEEDSSENKNETYRVKRHEIKERKKIVTALLKSVSVPSQDLDPDDPSPVVECPRNLGEESPPAVHPTDIEKNRTKRYKTRGRKVNVAVLFESSSESTQDSDPDDPLPVAKCSVNVRSKRKIPSALHLKDGLENPTERKDHGTKVATSFESSSEPPQDSDPDPLSVKGRCSRNLDRVDLPFSDFIGFRKFSNESLEDSPTTKEEDSSDKEVHDCKEKWRNIRSSFLRSLKAAPNGSKPKKPYYLKKHLHFVIPFIKPMSNTPPGGVPKRSERFLEADHDINSTLPAEAESLSNDYRDVMIKVEDSEPESEFKLSSELILPDDGGESSTPASLYAATELGDEELSRASHSQMQVPQTSQAKSSSVVRRRKRRANVALEKKINDLKSKIRKLEAGSIARPEPSGSSLGEDNGMRYFLVSLLPEFETMTQEQIRAFKIKVMMLIDEMKSK